MLLLLLLAVASLAGAQATPPQQKVVQGGFGSGGQWIETGNRLPDNWSPFPMGVCQVETALGRPLQAVGYPGDGTTCAFQPYFSSMPQIFRDGFVIAMSQDVYNGFHMADNPANSPRSPLGPQCTYDGIKYNATNTARMCGQGCGECYLVTGPVGSQVYIVNEISDIEVVGITQQGVNLNLGTGQGEAK